jgi:hypothetical protein
MRSTLPPKCPLLVASLALLLGMTSAVATAQPLPDPTRPTPGRIETPTAVLSAPPITRDKPPVPPLLQMVLSGGDRSQALIDGRVVRIGESVGGFRLAEVTLDGVTMEGAGQRLDIKILQSPQKQAMRGVGTNHDAPIATERDAR